MSDIAVQVENIGKKYRIGSYASVDLRNAFGHFVNRINPFSSSRHYLKYKEDFWALNNISFEIQKGEAVGIIGKNGAGKSTLLKILSRITEPTTGYFTLRGRVSSLLEVGTGFHLELTGRENIFLNGTILGMRRQEIREKFDEIVEFSGVGQFIDTPVKHYSSGMKVRLAFSVAAHLEPEILIIDEVLAVGDAEFQKKCLGKMEDVTGKGRTVLFVSHNLAAVNQLCQKGILLSQGELIIKGQVRNVIDKYVSLSKNNKNKNVLDNLELRKGDGSFRVIHIQMLDSGHRRIKIGKTGSELIFEVEFDRRIFVKDGTFRIDFAIDTEQNLRVGWFSSEAVHNGIRNGFRKIHLKISRLSLGSGSYFLTFYVTLNGTVVDYLHQGFSFEVEEGDYFGTGKTIPKSQTFIYSDHSVYSV